jgi:hypothetical protein
MATARPFAYNTGAGITGTDQVGDLAVGTPTVGFTATGLEWWNGPDEDLGYVIAESVPGDTQPTPVSGVSASVGFFRSSALTDPSFISIANAVAGPSGPFVSGSAAKTWLNANGYWTSYVGSTGGTGASTGNYNLLNQYSPAVANGSITFPGSDGLASNNPNTVGLNPGNGIYINKFDLVGGDQSSVLNSLVGRSGTLILTQGSNSVTYSFTSTAFNFTPATGGAYANQYWWDNIHNSSESPLNTITVTSPASLNFNYTDYITITVS